MKAVHAAVALGIAVSPIISPSSVAHADLALCSENVVDASEGHVINQPATEIAVADARNATGMSIFVRVVETMPEGDIETWWTNTYKDCHSWAAPNGSPAQDILVIGVDVSSKSSIIGHGALSPDTEKRIADVHASQLDPGLQDGDFDGAVTRTVNAIGELGNIVPKTPKPPVEAVVENEPNVTVLIIAGVVVAACTLLGILTYAVPAWRERRRRKKEEKHEQEAREDARVRESARKSSRRTPPTERRVRVPERTHVRDDADITDTTIIPQVIDPEHMPTDIEHVPQPDVEPADHLIEYALTHDAAIIMDEIKFVGGYMHNLQSRGINMEGRKAQLKFLASRYNAAGDAFRSDPLHARRELDAMMDEIVSLKERLIEDVFHTKALPGALPPALQTRQAAVEEAIHRALESAPKAIESGRHALPETRGRHEALNG